MRRSEPAGDDHGVVLCVVLVDYSRDLGDLVRDDRHASDADAPGVEAVAEPGRVRVLGVADEELVPDGDDGGVHTDSSGAR
ncbi:hypothetical protein BN903_26 [Halorubrum sp. AJ67]|nr:hypothetical protein BN903_26 [Halorubrum sp. AJ67]